MAHFGLQIPSFTFPNRLGDNVYDVARDQTEIHCRNADRW